jgi:hypothetical protein
VGFVDILTNKPKHVRLLTLVLFHTTGILLKSQPLVVLLLPDQKFELNWHNHWKHMQGKKSFWF